MLKKLLLFLLFLTPLISKENDAYKLALFGGVPSSVVGGHVNATTGDYFINQIDHTIRSHQPLMIQRSYSSRKGLMQFAGWDYPFNHTVAYWDCEDFILVPDKSGVSLIYELDREHRKKNDPLRFKLQECPGGITNCFTGEFSGRVDPTNNVIEVVKGTYDYIKKIVVKGPDGSKRYYKYFKNYNDLKESVRRENHEFPAPLFLVLEVLPNQNKIHYKWKKINGLYELEYVEVKNSADFKRFAWMNFHYDVPDEKHRDGVGIRTSDRRAVNYRINSHAKYQLKGQSNGPSKRSWLLTEVFLPERPDENYTRAW